MDGIFVDGRGEGNVAFGSILDGEKDVSEERIGFVEGSREGNKIGEFVMGFIDGAGVYEG